MDLLLSLFLLILYLLFIGFIIIYVSSFAGIVFMLLVPLIGVMIAPEEMAGFLSYKLFAIMDGAISMRNIHILLAFWAAFLSIVIYTEFLGWYMARISGSGSSDIEFPEDENFEARIEVDNDSLEVGEPLICRIIIKSGLFKAVLVRIEAKIDDVLVDTIGDEWIKCDIEHEITVIRPEVAGRGELCLFTSPPGFSSGPVAKTSFTIRRNEEKENETKEQSDFALSIPGGTSLDGIDEMKKIVEEWHEWKDELPSTASSPSDPALDQLCQMIDIYQDLLAIIAEYMNEGENFLESQLKDHLDITPDSLALTDLEELAECAGRSASLLIGRDKAMDLKNDILDLCSHYIERNKTWGVV